MNERALDDGKLLEGAPGKASVRWLYRWIDLPEGSVTLVSIGKRPIYRTLLQRIRRRPAHWELTYRFRFEPTGAQCDAGQFRVK